MHLIISQYKTYIKIIVSQKHVAWPYHNNTNPLRTGSLTLHADQLENKVIFLNPQKEKKDVIDMVHPIMQVVLIKTRPVQGCPVVPTC